MACQIYVWLSWLGQQQTTVCLYLPWHEDKVPRYTLARVCYGRREKLIDYEDSEDNHDLDKTFHWLQPPNCKLSNVINAWFNSYFYHPPRAHPPGIWHFSSLGVLFPTPGHKKKEAIPHPQDTKCMTRYFNYPHPQDTTTCKISHPGATSADFVSGVARGWGDGIETCVSANYWLKNMIISFLSFGVLQTKRIWNVHILYFISHSFYCRYVSGGPGR